MEGELTDIELVILSHALAKGDGGCAPSGNWSFMGSDIATVSHERAAYGRRFADVFPYERSISSFKGWVEEFQRIWDRRPQALELMGNEHFLTSLNLAGIFVNWTPEYECDVCSFGSSMVEINCDMEQIPDFTKMLDYALCSISPDDGKVDLIVWKGEGALDYLLQESEAFYYWWERLADLLRPGGSAFIQNPLYVEGGQDMISSLNHFAEASAGIVSIVYQSSQDDNRVYIRMDKL